MSNSWMLVYSGNCFIIMKVCLHKYTFVCTCMYMYLYYILHVLTDAHIHAHAS